MAVGVTASAMARAGAAAAFLTDVILSPAAARPLGRRTTRYGSTWADTSECLAIASMALRAFSRMAASFLLASCFLRASTVLKVKSHVSRRLQKFGVLGFCGCDQAREKF